MLFRSVGLSLSLEGIRKVYRVGEVHGTVEEEGLEVGEVGVFIWVVHRSFSKRQELGRDNSVDHMSSQSAHRLCFGDDNDILVEFELDDAQYPSYT